MTRVPVEKDVSIDYEGVTYAGQYAVDRDMIDVFYEGRKKCTQLGGHAQYPELLAKLLLREMVSGQPD